MASTDLFISEYVEGSSNNKAIEIFNGTGVAIDLAAEGYELQFFFNGSASPGTTIPLTGIVADGEVLVVADDGADAAILAVADQTPTNSFFNGNDAIALVKGGIVIDVIGQIGVDPVSQWGSDLTSTQDNTLRRLSSITDGDPNGDDAFDPAAEWEGFAQNTFDGLGTHTVNPSTVPTGELLITEIADPDNNASARYVELYASGGDVDLTGLQLVRWTNANPEFTASSAIALETLGTNGTLSEGEFLVIAANGIEFDTVYGSTADLSAGTGGPADSNGDDQIGIIDANGTILDIFGVPGEDGTGTDHEFEDGRAERQATATSARATYDAADWNIDNDSGAGDGPIDAPSGFDPGEWIGATTGGGPTLPTVTLVATDANASEAGPDSGIFTISRTGDTTAALNVAYTIGGTATSGDDFTALTGTVTIAAGSAEATIAVDPIEDIEVEGVETVTLTLTDTADYDLGAATEATVTIADNDGASSDGILNETFDYAELGQAAAFSVTDTAGAVSFFAEATSFDYFGVLDGDGDGGDDFGADPAPSNFNTYTGFNDNHLIASDIDGGSPAIAEPAFLTWSNLDISGLSTLLFSVEVATDDAPGSGGLDPNDFLKFEYSIDGGEFQNLLAFETADDSTFNQPTFLEDTDFDGIGDGTALTAAAQTFNQVFSVAGTTLDLRAAIHVESGFEDIGLDNVILEEAAGSFIAIAAADAVQPEGDLGTTPFTFTVTRTGDLSSAASVDFAVSGPVDGADFGGTLPTGTVTFAAGDDTETITLDVAGDTDAEGDETFTVALSNPSDDAIITTATAEGTIQNDDAIEITKIHTIQGNGSTQVTTAFGREDGSPLEGESVTVQGVVTAVFDDLNAFFLQEEDTDTDADSTTSEGIFVFVGSDPTVSEGNQVTVTGAVDEFFGMTQIDNDNGDFSVAVDDAGNNLDLVSSALINLPVTGDVDEFYEQYEGMLVQFSDKLVVSEYFQLARFGQIVLTADDRPFQYTHIDDTPTVAEFEAFQADLERRQIILDDGNNFQNAPLPDGTIFYPQPDGFGIGTQGEDFFRGGDSISDLTGVLHWSFAGFSGTDAWRIRPTEANPVEFTVENPRPAEPEEVGGNITVANFNVLNYFTTLDAGANTVGPNDLEPRGASSADELERQTTKLVAALAEIDADVFGLVELENDDDDATLQAIVDALNAEVGAGTYDFIPTGFTGTDAIKVGILYKPDVVTPQGDVAVLTDAAFTDPNDTGLQRNRPAVAQSFEVTDSGNEDFGESFSVVVNHFKSKGDSDLEDDPSISPTDVDQGDGQGFWNDTRTDAAEYLADVWIPELIAQGFDEDVLITGDLNAYRGEDPIAALKDAGYTDLIEQFEGDDAYSFVFDGQLGYLDYVLSSASLTPQVTGVTEWHINADEVNVFDYNNTVQDGNERSFEAEPSGNNLFEPNAFRTSDHDPVIVGLDLLTPETVDLEIGLFNAENDALITLIEADTEVLLSEIAGIDITLSSVVPDNSPFFNEVESMRLVLNEGAVVRTENVEPYALFGDTNGDFNGREDVLSVGTNTIDFELFSGNGQRGDFLGTVSRSFVVVDDLAVDPPIVSDDTLLVFEGEGLNPAVADINVLDNDLSSTGAALAVLSPVGTGISGSDGGEFVIQADGSVDFNANGDFEFLAVGETATTSVNITVGYSDGSSGVSSELLVTVEGENDAPIATDDEAQAQGSSTFIDVLVNDLDPDGSDSLSIIDVTAPSQGDALIEGNEIIYLPNESFDGSDSFEYTIADGNGGTDTAVVTITDDPVVGPAPVQVGLFDTVNDELIQFFEDGDIVDTQGVSTSNLTISAVVFENGPLAGQVESIVLDLNQGEVNRTENVEPYALFGDRKGDFLDGNISLGSNSLELELYSANGGNGQLLETVTLGFTLVDGTAS